MVLEPENSRMTNVTGFIPEEDYKKILENMPIPCVDVVLVYDGKFLLGRRINEPAKGQWWTFGGRIFKGEILKDAMLRKAKEEIGIDIDKDKLKLLGADESIFDTSAQGGSAHTVNIFFSYELEDEPEVVFDKFQLSEVKWFDKINSDWHPYVKLSLEKAGFK